MTILPESAPSLAFTTYVHSVPIAEKGIFEAHDGTHRKAGIVSGEPELALPTLSSLDYFTLKALL
jgi:hypothetical protein